MKRNWLVSSKLTWEIWWILTRALENLKNLHFNGLLLTKVYNVWAKKVQRSYVWWHWRLMQNLKENWLVLSKMTWRILQILENTTKIPSKYHKNSIRIPVLSTNKWVVFHGNNSGKDAINLDKISGSIPMVLQWNSINIPLLFQMFTSRMLAEFFWNTALKFPHLF